MIIVVSAGIRIASSIPKSFSCDGWLAFSRRGNDREYVDDTLARRLRCISSLQQQRENDRQQIAEAFAFLDGLVRLERAVMIERG